MSTASQKKAIKDFRAVTGSTEKIAMEFLKKQNYNLERAMDQFFNNPAKVDKTGDVSKLNKIFDKYAGSGDDKDSMVEDKLLAFFQSLSVDPNSAVGLGLVWKLGCASPGEITRKEFAHGFGQLGVDTPEKIKGVVDDIRRSFTDKKEFRKFYRWLFEFCLDTSESDRKTLEVDAAIEMWSIVMVDHMPLLTPWLEFLTIQHKAKKLKAVSKDLWEQTFEFARDIKGDLSNWDDTGAWPVIIDEFVEFVQSKKEGKEGKQK